MECHKTICGSAITRHYTLLPSSPLSQLTMFNEIQPDTPNNRHLTFLHRPQQRLHRNNLITDPRLLVEDTSLRDLNHSSLKLGLLGRGADVEVRGGQDGFAAEEAVVGRLEADEAGPGWHCGRWR